MFRCCWKTEIQDVNVCHVEGPIKTLPDSLYRKLFEFFPQIEVVQVHSKINKRFYEASRYIRLTTPVLSDFVYLSLSFGQVIQENRNKIIFRLKQYQSNNRAERKAIKKCLKSLENKTEKSFTPLKVDLAYKICMDKLIEEGILGGDDIISDELRNRLSNEISKFKINNPYRSRFTRYIVYPLDDVYLENTSEFIPSVDLPEIPKLNTKDMFGRRATFPDDYSFIATYIDEIGGNRWRFRNEINRIPKVGNEGLYSGLEELFSLCAHQLEGVIWYAQTLASPNSNYSLYSGCDAPNENLFPPRVKLQGKSLQVVISLLDNRLQKGRKLEEDFHFNGLPHEHIIATIDATLYRDLSYQGGELEFKREFVNAEVNSDCAADIGKNSEFLNLSCPLGKIKTSQGRVIIFPNAFIHRILPPRNDGSSELALKVNVLIFVVNPDIRIVSTQEVLVPQSRRVSIIK